MNLKNFKLKSNRSLAKLAFILIALSASLMFTLSPVRADVNVVDRPENGIYDPNHHLSQSTIDKVKTFNEMNDSQFDIYITDNLYDVSIDEVASTILRYWGAVSHSEAENGFVLAISTGDKKIELQPSISAYHYISDDQADSILDESIKYLESEDYDSAVVSIIDQLSYTIAEKRREDAESYENSIQNDFVASLDQKSNFFNSDAYRGAVYMFSALIIGVFVIPISLPIIIILVGTHYVNRKSKNIRSDTAVEETEVKESSHFDSPFE